MTRASRFGGTILGGGFLALALLSAVPARAQATVTPEQAKALETQLRGWVAGLVGPRANFVAVPIHILPEGDHYKLQENIAGLIAGAGGVSITSPPLTASIKQLDGGRWSVDNLLIPSPLKVIVKGAEPGTGGEITQTIASATMHGVIDPSLATTSSYDTTITGLSQTLARPRGAQHITVARLAGHGTMTPQGGQTVSLHSMSTAEGYASSFPMPEVPPVTIAIDKVQVGMNIDHLNFTRMGEVLHTIAAISALGKPDSPAGKALSHQLVIAVSDLLDSIDGSEMLTGLQVQGKTFSGSLSKLAMSGGFSAPGGKAEWHMNLALDGLKLPLLSAGFFHGFLPHHLNLSPRLSGISKASLVALVQKAIDDPAAGKANPMAMAMDLLQDGPLVVGLDTITFDMGPATLTGTGAVDVVSPMEFSGAGTIHVTGLDALIQQISLDPELKQIDPVLIFLKGIGEQKGDDTVWVIKYTGAKLSVNGTDMSAMLPAGRTTPQ